MLRAVGPLVLLVLPACSSDEEPAANGTSDAGTGCSAVCTHIVEAQCPHDKSLAECIAACEKVESGVPPTCRPLWDAYQSCRLDADYDCKDASQPNTVCTTELEALNACYAG